MRWHSWARFLAIGLMMGSVFAQQAGPPANPFPGARIVRVSYGSSMGMCSGDYCSSDTTVERGLIITASRNYSGKERLPDIEKKYRITKKDWEDLQHFIDAKILAAFTGRTGCPSCTDIPEDWAAVEFSDGSRKTVSLGDHPSPEISALFTKIQAIAVRAKPLRPQPKPPQH